jgi:O-antigen/teichoic acid export membrane protein
MKITQHLNKISWSVADKTTFALYGIATIAVLQVTNSIEFGLFTLFNNLHNFILAIGSYLGLQSLLHFSSDENEKPLINTYSLINLTIVISFITVIIFLFQNQIANILNEPNVIVIIQSLPVLMLISIPRYFVVFIMYRELKMLQVFVANLVYFGTMSGIIFYCVFTNRFLYCTDMIHITYLGSALSTVVAFILTFNYWKFSLKGATKYLDVVRYSAKYAVTGITLTLPKTLDVFAIQLFFGTHIVGLYAPAKTIFRFIDDAMNTVYAMIYAPTVKYFAANDIHSLNKLISKAISILMIGFIFITVICWSGGSNILEYFLPERFVLAIPFFNILMLSAILMPITLLITTISASGKPEIVSKYIIYSFVFWAISFYVIGTYFQEHEKLVAIPNLIFTAILSFFLFRYANKNYTLKFKQLFRSIFDFYSLILSKLKK